MRSFFRSVLFHGLVLTTLLVLGVAFLSHGLDIPHLSWFVPVGSACLAVVPQAIIGLIRADRKARKD